MFYLLKFRAKTPRREVKKLISELGGFASLRESRFFGSLSQNSTGSECFETLSMNGKSSTILNPLRRHHVRSKLFYSPRSAQRGYAATKKRDGSFTTKSRSTRSSKGRVLL
jgi:hypothetical protein